MAAEDFHGSNERPQVATASAVPAALGLWATLLIAGVVAGACGSPRPDGRGISPPQAFVRAQADEPVVAGSYLVGFGEPAADPHLLLSPTGSDDLQHSWQALLHEQHWGDERIKALAAIAPVHRGRQGEELTAALDETWPVKLAWAPSARSRPDSLLVQVDFVSNAAADAVLAEWRADGRIWFAEPNGLNTLFASEGERPGAMREASDGPFGLMAAHFGAGGTPWWVEQIKLLAVLETLGQEESLGLTRGPASLRPPVIAVLDSGVDYEHRALAAQIWRNPAPGEAGCLDDEFGCDTTRPTEEALGSGGAHPFGAAGPDRECGDEFRHQCMHGTHVAGVLAALPFPGGGGICPVCKILPIKAVEAVDGQGKVTDGAILRALRYIDNLNRQQPGLVQIVNSSFGKFQWSRAVALLVHELTQQGILFVAAAGNENSFERVFPAALPRVLAVTAVNVAGKKSAYANYGSWVDLAAPGGSLEGLGQSAVLSTVPGQGLSYSQGTSVATPMVAGVAGLLLASHPGLSSGELFSILKETADPRLYAESFAQGHNREYTYLGPHSERLLLLGSGLLDAQAAFQGRRQTPFSLPHDVRVTPGCAVVAGGGGQDQAGGELGFLVGALLMLPALLAYLGKKREGHGSCR